ELDPLALAQSPVAFLLNGGVVHEDIDAVADIDESVALSRVEPLHLTFRHFEVSFRPVPASYQVVACLSIYRAKEFWGRCGIRDARCAIWDVGCGICDVG